MHQLIVVQTAKRAFVFCFKGKIWNTRTGLITHSLTHTLACSHVQTEWRLLEDFQDFTWTHTQAHKLNKQKQKSTQKHTGGDPRPSSRPLSQTLPVVRLCVTPLSRLPGNRGCINMRGRKGAGDTSCLWSESNHNSVSVRRRLPSQHPPPLSISLRLPLSAL